MLLVVSIIAASALVILVLVQAWCAACFIAVLRRQARSDHADRPMPRAAILLSLRGADPSLARGLHSLTHQDYPNYELHIVVDRPSDPAWSVAETAMRNSAVKVYLSPLRAAHDSCSLKCSALAQMARELDESVEVIVLADADMVSHAGWLRELIEPLQEEGVGAAFGNRWFMPREGRWGSLVRYLWNTAAVVPMYQLGIPWGGTFSMRRSVLDQTGLVERWTKAVVEDAPVRKALADVGLCVRFVPSLMMVNREECGLGFSLDFIKRQLTWTRLYHPHWNLVPWHALGTTLLFLATAGLLVWQCVAADWPAAIVAGAGLAFYQVSMLVLLGCIEHAVRRVLRRRAEQTSWLSWRTLFRLPVAMFLTQGVQFIAVLLAMFRRQVAWRGVTYQMAGPWQIRMVGHVPFQQPLAAQENNTSL